MERSPGGGIGNARPSSCRENPTDREAWWATVQGLAQSWTRLHTPARHSSFQGKAGQCWRREFSLTAVLGEARCPPPRSVACSNAHRPLCRRVSPFCPSEGCPAPNRPLPWSRVLLTSSLDHCNNILTGLCTPRSSAANSTHMLDSKTTFKSIHLRADIYLLLLLNKMFLTRRFLSYGMAEIQSPYIHGSSVKLEVINFPVNKRICFE